MEAAGIELLDGRQTDRRVAMSWPRPHGDIVFRGCTVSLPRRPAPRTGGVSPIPRLGCVPVMAHRSCLLALTIALALVGQSTLALVHAFLAGEIGHSAHARSTVALTAPGSHDDRPCHDPETCPVGASALLARTAIAPASRATLPPPRLAGPLDSGREGTSADRRALAVAAPRAPPAVS